MESNTSTPISDTTGHPLVTDHSLTNDLQLLHSSDNSTANTNPLSSFQLSDILQQGFLSYGQFITCLAAVRLTGLILSSTALMCACLSVCVFCRQSLQKCTATLVIAFNLAEASKSLFYIIYRSFKLAAGQDKVSWSSALAQYFSHVVTWAPDASGRIGLLLNGAITIDRFIVLAFPLKHIYKPFSQHPKLTVVAIVLSMLIYQMGVKIVFQLLAVPRLDYSTNFTADELISVIAVQAPDPFRTYRSLVVIASILFHYLPILVGIVFNVLTIVSLVRHQKIRRSLTCESLVDCRERKQRQSNIMIVGSSLAFSVVVAIKPIVRLLSTVVPDFGVGKREAYLYLIFNECSLVLDNISCLVNFFFYCRLSSFRRVLHQMFQPRQTGPGAIN